MKTLITSLLVVGLGSPAIAGPDFATPSPRGRELAASHGTSEIGPLDDVVFDHDSAQLMSSAVDQIKSAARWLLAHRDHRVVLEGYADSTGFVLYNEDLATRRAETVRQLLLRHGVPSDRIVLVIYGEIGARRGPHPLDRRVVLYASKLPIKQIVAASLDRKEARAAVWTQNNTLFTEHRERRNQGRTQISSR